MRHSSFLWFTLLDVVYDLRSPISDLQMKMLTVQALVTALQALGASR